MWMIGLKLLYVSPRFAALACLEKFSTAAIVNRQEATVRMLLVHLPTNPYSELLDNTCQKRQR